MVAPKSPKCNCREENTCPLNGNCQATSVIYQAKVKTATGPEKNIYKTYRRDMEAKKLHTQIIIQQPKIHQLSKHIWKLMENNQAPEITWSIKTSAPAYTNITKRCMLCLQEKMTIITFPDEDSLLNRRSELISK